jgi:pyruvate oxidase
MGETILPLADAIRRQDRVRFIDTQHEEAAAFAASAYAKLTDEPAACLATGGPGATALMTGVYDAMSDGVPLLAITGQVRRTWEHEGARQEIDACALFAPASVFNAQIDTAPQAPLLLAGALHAAIARRGVAHLSLPMDLQSMEANIEAMPPGGHLSGSLPAAAVQDVRLAARLLEGARRPLILAGGGARRAREPLRALGERLGAPILMTCRSKGLIPASDPLAAGIPGLNGTPWADDLLREADCLLVVGCSLSQATTGNWHLIRPEQQLVQIDLDAAAIGRLYPVEVGLWGDAAAALRQLVAELPQQPGRALWVDLRQRKADWQRLLDTKVRQAAAPIKPQFVVRALQHTLPADAIITLDAGDHAFFMCQQYQPKGESFCMSYHLGSTGFALPAALAAALAYPERQAVAVLGDAGLSYSLGELLTAVAHSLPVLVVCFNNHRLGMIGSQEERLGLPPFFTERPVTDFARVAEALGVSALHVEEPGALEAAIHQGLQAHRPFLLDVAIDPLETQSTALQPERAVAV